MLLNETNTISQLKNVRFEIESQVLEVQKELSKFREPDSGLRFCIRKFIALVDKV